MLIEAQSGIDRINLRLTEKFPSAAGKIQNGPDYSS